MSYKDFIDTNMEEVPYSCGMEETVSYLGWLDMFLEGYETSHREDDSEEDKSDAEALRAELRAGAQSLHNRQMVSAGKYQDIEKGISICNIAGMFGLEGYRFFCLLLAVAPTLDEEYTKIYERLRDDGFAHGNPTFAFAEKLYALIADEDDFLKARSSINSIRACPLFKVRDSKDNSSELYDRFVASRQLVSLLKGDFDFDNVLNSVCTEVFDTDELAPVMTSQNEYARLELLLAEGPDPHGKQLIHITGARGSGKKFLVAHSVSAQPVLYVDVETLLKQGAENSMRCMNEIIVRACCLDSMLVLCNASAKKENLGVLNNLLDFCFAYISRVIMTSETTENMYELAMRYDYSHIAIPACRGVERRTLWDYYSEKVMFTEDVSLENYAYTYRFTPGTIRKCIEQAEQVALSKDHYAISNEDLRESIRYFNSSKLSELAVLIPQKFGWDDIEIDSEQKDVMRLACARAKLGGKVDEEWGFEKKVTYGKGMSILLYGPPGTGKTMAAQIMAKDVGMDLYRVDLSQLVDKYIGETQKNIGRIFDCAKEGNFVLFFDEADSMFSKRTDIQNSNDKHANTETSYLLQKMEEYDGITILATNRYNNFDDAFLRRLTYTIRLEMPDAPTRLRLFKSILPAEAPISPNLDLEFFAETFELTGSNIKNVLYNAAFMAASENAPINNAHIVRALKFEFEKQRKMLLATDLGSYSAYLI